MAHLDLLAGVIVSLGIIFGLIVAVGRAAARITRVHDVILGSSEKPGVIFRLDLLEKRTEQLIPNGGGSLKDVVGSTSRMVTELSTSLETDRVAIARQQGGYEEALRKLQHDLTGTRSAMSLMTHLIDKINQDRFLKEQMWATTLRQQGLVTPDPTGITTPLNINEPPGEHQ